MSVAMPKGSVAGRRDPRRLGPALRRNPQRPRRSPSLPTCTGNSIRRGCACSSGARSARRASMPASCRISSPRRSEIREGDWKVAPIPADLLDRRVEITGPVDRKMIINALNSGAKVFMADFEDANSPTWANLIEGQINLKDRWAGTIDFTDPTTGKAYKLVNEARRASRPPARLAPARGASRQSTAQPMSGVALRLRPLLLPSTPRPRSPRAAAPISTCPRWRAISRRGCGTRSSPTPRRRSASRTARSRRRC